MTNKTEQEKTRHTKQEQDEDTLTYSSYCSEVNERRDMFYSWTNGCYYCDGCGKRVHLNQRRLRIEKKK